jgi:hypothetical protein
VIRGHDRHQPKIIVPRGGRGIDIRWACIGCNHIPRPPIHRHQPISRRRHIGRIIDREGDATCPHLQARRRSADLVCTDGCRARRNHRYKLIRSYIGIGRAVWTGIPIKVRDNSYRTTNQGPSPLNRRARPMRNVQVVVRLEGGPQLRAGYYSAPEYSLRHLARLSVSDRHYSLRRLYTKTHSHYPHSRHYCQAPRTHLDCFPHKQLLWCAGWRKLNPVFAYSGRYCCVHRPHP